MTAGSATSLVVAAAREIFEECGVLFAATSDGRQAAVGSDELVDLRRQVIGARRSLVDVLAARDWLVWSDMLRPWSHWITPEVRARRYDTRFFIAAVPRDQVADGSTSEATAVQWCRPVDALKAHDEERVALMLPTRSCLEELADIPDVAATFRSGMERQIRPVLPTITLREGKEIIALPGCEQGR